jgi:hypothetical protein
MGLVSTNAVPPVLAGTALNPRNTTWIAGGILQGSVEVGMATHTNKSMLVLTDGMENVHPYVAQLPPGTITNRTFAVGLGLPADISTAVLQQIAANTNGDLIITGNISTAEQDFFLTKYFVQILAGATNMNVILDPQGSLFFGSKAVIPFNVTGADIYVDVIALCPIPQLLDFTLETPAGEIIKPAGGPNVKYAVRPLVAFYRVTLPALPADPAGSQAGQWKAILQLKDPNTVDKLLNSRAIAATAAAAGVSDSLPYSLVAHAYSNLQFDAGLQQSSLAPGANVTLRATLTQYSVPFTGTATVWAEIIAPDLTTLTVALKRIADGVYSGSLTASLPGVYPCRVRAEGYVNMDQFTREKRLTAITYYGNHGTTPPDDTLCSFLHCLTSEKVLTKAAAERLRNLGIDIAAFRKCIEEHCPEPAERAPGKPQAPVSATKINIKTERPARPIKIPKARPPRMQPRPGAPVTFPRIIHMFSPEEPPMPGAMKAQPPKKKKRRKN